MRLSPHSIIVLVMKRIVALLFFVVLFLSSCEMGTKTPTAAPDAKRYILKGRVISVDKVNQKAVIAHETVQDFMEPMTMPFKIYDRDVLETLRKNNEIKAELVINPDQEYWLENIVISAAPTAGQAPPPINDNFVQIDKEVPDFKLVNQMANLFHCMSLKSAWNSFHLFALSASEYCILMSQHLVMSPSNSKTAPN